MHVEYDQLYFRNYRALIENTTNSSIIDAQLNELQGNLSHLRNDLINTERDEQSLVILFRQVLKTYTEKVPLYLQTLRNNYLVIQDLVTQTTGSKMDPIKKQQPVFDRTKPAPWKD